MSRRIVVDTSTLVSAAIRVGSVPYQALAEVLSAWELSGSVETLAELEHVLTRKRFDRYLDRTLREKFFALIRRNVHLFPVPDAVLRDLEPRCRDAKDDHFLALALAAEADVVVSSDQDLLVLNPWRGIPIVTPGEFLLRTQAR